MKMRSFMKKKQKETVELTTDELIATFSDKKSKKSFKLIFGCVALVFAAAVFVSFNHGSKISTFDLDEDGNIALAANPIAATTQKKDVISIPAGTVKANPFLPYRNIGGNDDGMSDLVNDVPKFDLLDPPESISADSEASRVMDTVVSGILFDKTSPSAILNIEGNDYLVKKGDTVNNYKILAIAQDSVTVRLGNNTFKAGIGEILTEGSVTHNDVSNLNKKFGGERRWDIIIYKDFCQQRYY